MPNPAFLRARADDLFWGARRVMAFTDEMIAAAVASASYTDPRAARHITETLIARRDLIGRAWLSNVNPIVDPSFDGRRLAFNNAAVDAGVAPAPTGYRATWFSFDNATGESTRLSDTTATEPLLLSPDTASTLSRSFVRVDVVAAEGAPQPWTVPVSIYFRPNASGRWDLVGLERATGPTSPE